MSQRITITLTPERHAALKQTAAARGKTMGEVIDESLERCGVRTANEALDLVRRARSKAGLTQERALDVALAEVRTLRSKRG
jgi:D-serine deaminase-like pyridoxal phosphate-dependent protein